MEVFRGECNFSQSSGVRRKGKFSTGRFRILNAIAQSIFSFIIRFVCLHQRLLGTGFRLSKGLILDLKGWIATFRVIIVWMFVSLTLNLPVLSWIIRWLYDSRHVGNSCSAGLVGWGVKRYLVPVQSFFVVPQSPQTRLIPIMKSNIKQGNIACRVFQYWNAVCNVVNKLDSVCCESFANLLIKQGGRFCIVR